MQNGSMWLVGAWGQGLSRKERSPRGEVGRTGRGGTEESGAREAALRVWGR